MRGKQNAILERVEFTEFICAQTEDIISWQTRCSQQGGTCEYCDQYTPELIRERFIVGINDRTLMTKLINSALSSIMSRKSMC